MLVLSSTGSLLHGQLLQLGDNLFGNYYLLRGDIPKPSCNPDMDIESRLKTLEAQASESSDGLDALFEEEAFNVEASRNSLKAQQKQCIKKHEMFKSATARVTTPVKIYRAIELTVEFFALFVFEFQKTFIVLLVFLGGLSATIRQHHIAFRPITSAFEHKLSHGIECAAVTFILLPSIYSHLSQESLNRWSLQWLFMIAASIFALTILTRLLVPFYSSQSKHDSQSKHHLPPKQGLGRALLTIPIYVYMLIISGCYFFIFSGHIAGISIHVNQLFEQAEMFLKVGLYIWLGMLLKQTGIAQQIFALIRPWAFPPAIMALLAVVIMAVPTAYTGASGIIIIAMGAVVYAELCKAGTSRNLAFAATAMTGSAGVVLRPCLLVVIIAALNKEVVTAALYMWGGRVFLLSTIIFLLVLAITYPIRWHKPSWAEIQKTLNPALRNILPILLIFIGITLAYRFLLDAHLDEISAPVILPVIIVIIIWYQLLQARKQGTGVLVNNNSIQEQTALKASPQSTLIGGFGKIIKNATSESSVHVGALLMLMAFSFATGGVIERADVMGILPQEFSSEILCMLMLVVLLVLIGMVMDPFGAVVLVSGSVAAVAYNNGINPIHFWMVTLVAFELGYLSPPVALNHLLTRQVVGEQEAMLAEAEARQCTSFWGRNERLILPITVMGITLLLVSFVPFLAY